MMTDELLSTDDILDAFATAGRVLPRVALEQAAERWPEVAPVLLSQLEAAAGGAEHSERTDEILFFTIYLMAQCRETRAYRPLCTIATDGERLSDLIGDGVTEDFAVILTRVYDGDPAPLRALIEAKDAYEFNRFAALSALAWLTATGRMDRNQTAAYLGALFATLEPRVANSVWVGWQEAIAYLGLEDLASTVEIAFALGWVDPMWLGPRDFREDLDKALRAEDPTSLFDSAIWDGSRFDDIVSTMAEWACFQPEEPKAEPRGRAAPSTVLAPRSVPDVMMDWAQPPVRNPHRHVGRNDPCVCGSGKKFKKCCLETVR